MPSRFEKFSERARRTLSLAQEESQRFGHSYIGAEHILIGLMRDPECSAAKLLASLNVDLAKARSVVAFTIGRGERRIPDGIGLNPQAKKVIELAVDEARLRDDHYIGTAHLLLGVVLQGEGVAGDVLESLGVTAKNVRAELERFVDSSTGDHRGSVPGGEWPQFLKNLAVELKRVEMLKNEAMFQQNFESAASLRQEMMELERRFEEVYAVWARSQTDGSDPALPSNPS